jgi:hypothetical protein
MKTDGMVVGGPMATDGPVIMVVQCRLVGRGMVGNADGWAGEWLSHADGWAEEGWVMQTYGSRNGGQWKRMGRWMMYNRHGWASEWGAMETDGPVDGCPMQTDGPRKGGQR